MSNGWMGFEGEDASWEYTSFSAADLVLMAGLPLQLQRAWRSRNHLAGGSGKRALFSSRDVADNFIRYQLSLNGLPPGESEQIGDVAADLMIYFALLSCDGAAEIKGPIAEGKRFLTCFEADDSIANEIAGCPKRDSYLWRGDGGNLSFVGDISSMVEQQRFVANFYVDLMAAALRLAERAAKPLVSIELSASSTERRFRWLTGGQFADIRSEKPRQR